MSLSKVRRTERTRVCDELGLGYPLEELLGANAPSNESVLLHLIHFLRIGPKGCFSVRDGAFKVATSIKERWRGSNIDVAADLRLVTRIQSLYSMYRLVDICYDFHLNG